MGPGDQVDFMSDSLPLKGERIGRPRTVERKSVTDEDVTKVTEVTGSQQGISVPGPLTGSANATIA